MEILAAPKKVWFHIYNCDDNNMNFWNFTVKTISDKNTYKKNCKVNNSAILAYLFISDNWRGQFQTIFLNALLQDYNNF